MSSETELVISPRQSNSLAILSFVCTNLCACLSAVLRFAALLFIALIGFGLTCLYGTMLFSMVIIGDHKEVIGMGIASILPICSAFQWIRQNRFDPDKTSIEKARSSQTCNDKLAFTKADGRISVIDSPWWALPFCLFSIPGLIALIPAVILICLPAVAVLVSTPFTAGMAVALPIFFSYKMFLKLSRKYYQIHIGKPGLLVISGSRTTTQSILWDHVKAVKLVRLEHINEADFHADELDQQQVVLEHREADSISIPLNLLNHGQRIKLARSLKERLNAKVFAESSLTLLKQLAPDQPKLERAKNAEPASFTEVWQSDMKRHIGRTNYVPLEVGAMLQNGTIKINSYLSSGGFSTTYIAESKAFGGDTQVIVIKESSLPQGLNDEAKGKISDMFAREARLLTKCDHPKIAKVLDFFHENGREYLALDYLEGARLSDVIGPQSKPSEAQCLSWGFELAEMLKYLHNLQPPIVHRDFTPDNIILSASGNLHLIDFGAANEFLGGATGTLVGKQSYIAPEQFQGKATTQSDVYALGAMLYFLLTAQEPLPLSAAHPRSLRPDVSQEFDRLIAGCTEPDAEKRIGSAEEVLKQLEAIKRLSANPF